MTSDMNIEQAIKQAVDTFAASVFAAVRGATLGELEAATAPPPNPNGVYVVGKAVPGVVAIAKRARRLVRGDDAPRPSVGDGVELRPGQRIKLVGQSASILDAERIVLAAVGAAGVAGVRAEHVRTSTGLDAKAVSRALKGLLRTGKIQSHGQKRATTYYT